MEERGERGGRERGRERGHSIKSKPPPSLPNHPPTSHYEFTSTSKMGPQRTIAAPYSRKFCTFIASPLKWARIYKEARPGLWLANGSRV